MYTQDHYDILDPALKNPAGCKRHPHDDSFKIRNVVEMTPSSQLMTTKVPVILFSRWATRICGERFFWNRSGVQSLERIAFSSVLPVMNAHPRVPKWFCVSLRCSNLAKTSARPAPFLNIREEKKGKPGLTSRSGNRFTGVSHMTSSFVLASKTSSHKVG